MWIPFRLLACTVLVMPAIAPLAGGAQTAPSHVAPKLLQRGTNVTAAAGPGDVTVQVFVKKDGSFEVSKIIKSSNPADNAAALEIAKSSKYKPATNAGAPVDEYYDFTVSFNGDTAAMEKFRREQMAAELAAKPANGVGVVQARDAGPVQ